MKKVIFILGIFISIFIFANNVYATECSYDEQLKINQDSSAISVNYSQNGASLKVFINNLSSLFYAKIIMPDGTERIFSGNDNLEAISFDWFDTSKPYYMNIGIYTSNLTGCPNTFVINKDINLPMYNKYSESNKCINNENLYVCQKFVDVEVTNETFDAAIRKVDNKNNINNTEKNIQNIEKNDKKNTFFDKNKVLIISISTVVVVGIIIGILGVRSRRKII